MFEFIKDYLEVKGRMTSVGANVAGVMIAFGVMVFLCLSGYALLIAAH